ncbi:MAG TPA: VOC family protein [Thermoanaerobaculia bacterium]|nr:VOC family protein [Thermoanaerobaculia bacterium]
MLAAIDAMATVAVKDLQRARKFCQDTLGLNAVHTDQHFIRYRSGNAAILVYVSSFAGTNRATAVTWAVGDELENIVSALNAKGVEFEHYDLPQTVRKGDIHVSGKTRVAWLKDPDGNILSLVSG